MENNSTAFGSNLAATNHFRLLKPPSYCYRYSRISDSLTQSQQITIARNWNILKSAGVTTNLQTIQYSPVNHFLRLSFAEPGIPAYQIEPTQINAAELFQLVGIHEHQVPENYIIRVNPNPCAERTTITISTGQEGIGNCKIVNARGQLIKDMGILQIKKEFKFDWETSNVVNGVYIILFEFNERGAKKTFSEKILIAN